MRVEGKQCKGKIQYGRAGVLTRRCTKLTHSENGYCSIHQPKETKKVEENDDAE